MQTSKLSFCTIMDVAEKKISLTLYKSTHIMDVNHGDSARHTEFYSTGSALQSPERRAEAGAAAELRRARVQTVKTKQEEK